MASMEIVQSYTTDRLSPERAASLDELASELAVGDFDVRLRTERVAAYTRDFSWIEAIGVWVVAGMSDVLLEDAYRKLQDWARAQYRRSSASHSTQPRPQEVTIHFLDGTKKTFMVDKRGEHESRSH